MGLLIKGKWKNKWYDTRSTGGRFVRKESQFRNWVTTDGSSGYKAEPHRYHLYISLACPWAHRTTIFLKLKDLEEIISVSIVDPVMGDNGWEFTNSSDTIPDTLYGKKFLYQIYTKAKPDCSGRVTTPVLWDKKNETIVNNESSEIIRMFNSEFNEITKNSMNYYPKELQDKINQLNSIIYENVNNGVYKCGFATTQEAYDESFFKLFDTLENLENILEGNRYLTGSIITEADWRLFTTLIRFDIVYYNHFKCNLKRIEDFENLRNYLRDLYRFPGIKETVNLEHIKTHYYVSHKTINPSGIIPNGPEIDYDLPSKRLKLK